MTCSSIPNYLLKFLLVFARRVEGCTSRDTREIDPRACPKTVPLSHPVNDDETKAKTEQEMKHYLPPWKSYAAALYIYILRPLSPFCILYCLYLVFSPVSLGFVRAVLGKCYQQLKHPNLTGGYIYDAFYCNIMWINMNKQPL